MADGDLKTDAGGLGKLLRTAAGLLKLCQCCDDVEVDEYYEHRNCCNQCRSVYMHRDVASDCSGSPGSPAVLKWRGKCYLATHVVADPLTRAQAEATGRPVVLDSGEVECLNPATYANCAAAQADLTCPACTECCLRWYPSKACFLGAPDNPQNSVCCNLGRQALFVSTARVINVIGQWGPWIADADGCHYEGDPWVTQVITDMTETVQCRWRARCPATSPCIDVTLSQFTREGIYDGAASGTANCTVIGSGACTNRAIAPDPSHAFCNAYRPTSSDPYTCTGDYTSLQRPLPPLDCGGGGCAGCGLDAYPCHSLVFTESWNCARTCRSGTSSRTDTEIRRPYDYGFYCPGNPCEAQLGVGVCGVWYNHTSFFVIEWEFIVEDEEGCLSDNTCFQYNGECLEATEGLTTPDEICSDPVCEPPPGDSAPPPETLMAPVVDALPPIFDADSAGGLF